MNPPEPFFVRAARWLTFGSAVAIMFSIAASQVLLALAFAALLASGLPLRLPRIKWPLALFMLGTLISLAFSGDPTAGLPQVRKFYVFLELLVVYSALRNLKLLRWLFLTWAGFGALTAIRGFVQFAGKVHEAHELGRGFYDYYVGERITGFTSHWNTYSAEEMFAFIMVGALLLFAPRARRAWIWFLCALLIAAAVLLGETRGVWIAAAAAALYLVWFWRRWLIALVPLAVLLAYVVSPAPVRERFTSIVRPTSADSNQFRIVTWRTGMVMIEKHPLLGVGPEGVKNHFMEYVPADIPRPLPTGWYGHLHNIYLHYAAERGIPTMLVLLWMLIQILVDFWRGLRTLPPGPSLRRFLLHGGAAVVLAAMVEGCVELNLGDSEVLTMFLVAVAAGYLALDKNVAEA
ncbi:MAG: O-antigen ligase family protein [Bryobacteraceae bacterium]|jgi:O-antigen ligase